jgi:hypothetical protein
MRAPGLATALVALLALAPPTAVAAIPPGISPALSLHASPETTVSGNPVTLSGQATGAPAGSSVTLYASPYPYTDETPIASATTAADGSFSFTAAPDRNTDYRVALAGGLAQSIVHVGVADITTTTVRALSLGRAEVTVVVHHPADLRWTRARVQWWFASGPGASFTAAPSTQTLGIGTDTVELRATVTLPAGWFRWRACFSAPGDQALLNARRPPGCDGRGYHGAARLPSGFPRPGAVGRASAYLSSRGGRTAFAVVDSEGRLSGVRVHETFFTASVVKAMLLVAYLRRLDASGQHHVDAYSNSFLYPMIHVSDNNAATQCWSIVGDSGLYAVASAAGMSDFSVSGLWGSALLSPADQARFFFEMDSLIPREFVGYARFLLSTIDPSQSWAIPAVARPLGYKVFFKDGSEPVGAAQLVHQVARLEGHRRTFSIAVMTDGDPSMQYGIDTIAGVTRALLR